MIRGFFKKKTLYVSFHLHVVISIVLKDIWLKPKRKKEAHLIRNNVFVIWAILAKLCVS